MAPACTDLKSAAGIRSQLVIVGHSDNVHHQDLSRHLKLLDSLVIV